MEKVRRGGIATPLPLDEPCLEEGRVAKYRMRVRRWRLALLDSENGSFAEEPSESLLLFVGSELERRDRLEANIAECPPLVRHLLLLLGEAGKNVCTARWLLLFGVDVGLGNFLVCVGSVGEMRKGAKRVVASPF